jgi:micrococcal nuclease
MAHRRGLPGVGAIALLAVALFLLIDGCEDGGGDSQGVGARPGDRVSAEVVRAVDGDTIEVSLDGETEDVRYIGVDTPETVAPGQPVECFGHRASEANADLVEGETVTLVFDHELRDDYGRLLAYVYVGDRLVNAELVRRGLARTLEIAPNTSKAPRVARLEARAGRAGRGLWGPSVC